MTSRLRILLAMLALVSLVVAADLTERRALDELRAVEQQAAQDAWAFAEWSKIMQSITEIDQSVDRMQQTLDDLDG